MNFNKSGLPSLALLITGVLPFFALGFFAQPYADDFMLAERAQESASIFGFVGQFYMEWSGRYFGLLMNTFNPLNNGQVHFYYLPLVINILLFYTSVIVFFRQLFKALNTDDKNMQTAMLFLFLINGLIFSSAELYYWFASASMYLLSLSAGFFLFAILLKQDFRIFHWLIAPVLISGITACNEVSMMAWMLFLVLYISSKMRSNHLIRFDYYLIVLSVLSIGLVVFAPGNTARAEVLNNSFNLWYALQNGFLSTLKMFAYCLQSPALWLAAMLMILVFPKAKADAFTRVPLRFFLLITILLPLLLYIGVYFALGSHPAWRIHNVIQILFLLLLSISLMRFKSTAPDFNILPFAPALRSFLWIALFVLTLGDFTYRQEKGSTIVFRNNIPEAWYDLATMALPYQMEMLNRYDLVQEYKGKQESVVILKPIQHVPSSLFMGDLTNDPGLDNTHRIYFTSYFGLKNIEVEDLP